MEEKKEMNSQFIRTFADDLSNMRRDYYRGSRMEEYICETVIKLHNIASVVEGEEENVRENSKDIRK